MEMDWVSRHCYLRNVGPVWQCYLLDELTHDEAIGGRNYSHVVQGNFAIPLPDIPRQPRAKRQKRLCQIFGYANCPCHGPR